MPKDTFLNLPSAKRQFIEDVAMEEFATRGFDNASVNRIVAGAQIAKGSFYQYFEDKKDLFKHLVARITEKKLDYLTPVLLNPAVHDFFTLLTDLYRSGLAFAKDNPQAGLVGNMIYKNKEHPVYREIMADNKTTAREFYENLLQEAITRGEVRSDLNPRFVGHLLYSMSMFIFEYYAEEVRGEGFSVSDLEDDLMETVHMTLDFIKYGITLEAKELSL